MNTKIWILLTILGGVLILFRPPIDPDFGWHFTYGKNIIDRLQVPRENTFSYTLPNYEWADSYWLSEVLLYVLYAYLGAIPAGMLLSLLFAASVTLLVHVATKRSVITYGVSTALFVLLSSYLLPGRPIFFSSLFCLFVVYILLYREKYRLLLIPLFVLWANMHADFVLGLSILGLFTLWRLVVGIKSRSLRFLQVAALLGLPVVCLVATLLNPYGPLLWKTLFKEANITQFLFISEWLPINATKFSELVIFLFPATLCLFSAVYSWRRFGAWYAAVCIVFFVLFLRSKYFFRVLLLVSPFGLGVLLAEHIRLPQGPFMRAVRVLLPLYAVLVFLVFASVFVGNVLLAQSTAAWSVYKGYPFAAVHYIKEHQLSGKMFNSYGWGGFLIWQLPEHPTFIDGRMPSWSKGSEVVFKDYIEITGHPESFDTYQKKYGFSWVLDTPKSKLATYLTARPESQWVIEYEDAQAVLLIMRSNIHE